MSPALIVRFRPAGPWRFGPENGARDQVDRVFHSDSLYSAITIAMRDLGWLTHWVAVTAESESPAVRLSSCFPYIRRSLMVQPPRSVWPPAQTGKLRWKAARFVPVSVVPALLRGEDLNEEQWAVEPVSGCLLPMDRNTTPAPPFRVVTRYGAAVDRVTGASEEAFGTACLQFTGSAGVWFAAVFEDDGARDTWAPRLRSAARLLADSGVGGERSRGWGRSAAPSFEDVSFPSFLTGDQEPGGERAWWMLSLFSPSERDEVEWSRGNYEVVTRAGRVETHGSLKPGARMVSEGSVVLSAAAPSGVARDVGVGVGHPVYRSGIAVAVPIGWQESRRLSWLAGDRPAAVAQTIEGADVIVAAAPDAVEALISEPLVAEVPGSEAGEPEVAEVPVDAVEALTAEPLVAEVPQAEEELRVEPEVADAVEELTGEPIASEPVTPESDEEIASEPVMPESDEQIASEPVMPESDEEIASEPVLRESDEEIASEPVMPESDDDIASEPVMPESDEEIASEPVMPESDEQIASEPEEDREVTPNPGGAPPVEEPPADQPDEDPPVEEPGPDEIPVREPDERQS